MSSENKGTVVIKANSDELRNVTSDLAKLREAISLLKADLPPVGTNEFNSLRLRLSGLLFGSERIALDVWLDISNSWNTRDKFPSQLQKRKEWLEKITIEANGFGRYHLDAAT